MNEYGPSLFAYLQHRWEREGLTMNGWCQQYAFQPPFQLPTLTRWRDGVTEPSLQNMVKIADVLGVPRLAVLTAAGVIDGGKDQ